MVNIQSTYTEVLYTKKLRFLLLVFKLKYYDNKKITTSTISKLY